MNFTIPPQLESLMLSRGSKGEDWLKSLPAVLSSIESQWQIKLSTPFLKCYCNYVTKAITASGKKVVIKVNYPDEEFTREVGYLKLQSKEIIPEILKIDETIPAMMMEEIEPATSLTSITNENKAISIAANLMKKTWKKISPNNIFRKTDDLYTEFQRLKNDKKLQNIFSDELVQKAENSYHKLQQNPPDSLLIHGDLHQFNIIYSNAKGWLIIDPGGFYSEPAYEVSAFLRNPPDISNNAHLKDLLTNRVKSFSQELNIEAHRILWWGLFQTVLSSWWAREDNSDFLKGFEKTAITLGEIEL